MSTIKVSNDQAFMGITAVRNLRKYKLCTCLVLTYLLTRFLEVRIHYGQVNKS